MKGKRSLRDQMELMVPNTDHQTDWIHWEDKIAVWTFIFEDSRGVNTDLQDEDTYSHTEDSES